MATLLLSVMGAFAEFERALIRERQREGVALTKEKGVYKGRRPALSNEQRIELRRRVESWRVQGAARQGVRGQPGDALPASSAERADTGILSTCSFLIY